MIGYYVHHQGAGHLARASALAAVLSEPVVALTSLSEPAVHPFEAWMQLPPDPAIAQALDPTAGGALHWSPLDSSDYAARVAGVVAWVAAMRPRLVVVDVSVEVIVAVRLAGTPVVTVTLPGRRDDPAHQLGFRMSSLIVAPWPAEVYRPGHLDAWSHKTVWCGAVSRFDADARSDRVPAPDRTGRVLVLHGVGGQAPEERAVAAARTVTGRDWTSIGGPRGTWSADVWRLLHDADVVVLHAGLNAVAEVAAARRPAVVIAQDRPFDEQRQTASALAVAGLAVAPEEWPDAEQWPAILARAAELGGTRWARWNDLRGAGRFARALESFTP